ncbi:MAG TPA: nitroreductase [Micromonosporaceae bacterium]|nr:nitroreductase [Micromonosporaceae bacterium]
MSNEPRPVTAVLAEAIEAAAYAPSVHNTQPWRWRIDGDDLLLYADRDRQLVVSDPDGRMLTVSCGAALAYARTALAAEGYGCTVETMPEPADPDLLARASVTGRVPVDADSMRLFQTALIRHTDRRPVSDTPVPPGAVDALRAVAESEHVSLHHVPADRIPDLAAAVDRAQRVAADDPAARAEMARWAGGDRPDHSGVPNSAIPAATPQTTVPARDFGHPGTLQVGAGHDRFAHYLVLFGPGDEPADWLAAGEALSACWLAAIEHGLSLVPISAAVEVPATREAVRRLIGDLGHPYLVMRIGVPDPEHPGPPRTPRREPA